MQQALTFVTSHSAILAALAVAVLDFVMALNPAAASNGLIHWAYNFLKGKSA